MNIRRPFIMLLTLAILFTAMLPFGASAADAGEVIQYALEQFAPLTIGDESENVVLLQQRLVQLGYLEKSEEPTFSEGVYDEATEQALAACLTVNEVEFDTLGTPDQQLFILSDGVLSDENITFGAFDPEKLEVLYIGNKNTKKFHAPDCASVGDMKDANKVPLFSRDEAIDGGYAPCKRCNP